MSYCNAKPTETGPGLLVVDTGITSSEWHASSEKGESCLNLPMAYCQHSLDIDCVSKILHIVGLLLVCPQRIIEKIVIPQMVYVQKWTKRDYSS